MQTPLSAFLGFPSPCLPSVSFISYQNALVQHMQHPSLVLQDTLFWISKIGDSGLQVWDSCLHSQAFQNPWIFFTKFTMVTANKKTHPIPTQPFSQKGMVLKFPFLSFHSPSSLISGLFVVELTKEALVSWCTQFTLGWLVGHFLFKFLYSFVALRKLSWNCRKLLCVTVFCTLADVNSKQRWEFLVAQVLPRKKSSEALKWVSSSWQDSVCTHWVCCVDWLSAEPKQQQSYKGISLLIETLKKTVAFPGREWSSVASVFSLG